VDFGTGFEECRQYCLHQVSNQGEQQNLWPCWELTNNAQAPTQAVNTEARRQNVNKLNRAENFLGKLGNPEPVKKFPTLYETQRFIFMFTTTCHLSPS